MRIKVLLAAASLTLACALLASAQSSARLTQITATSWSRGPETVSEQMISISLDRHRRAYSTEIVATSGKRYRLRVIPNPLPDVKADHWKVELRERLNSRSGQEQLGENLLEEPAGPNRHYFPREDFIGYLYPERATAVVNIGGVPWIEGFPFYPIRALRRIRVDGFYLILRVDDLQFDFTDPKAVDFLNLSIEFRNARQFESRLRPSGAGCGVTRKTRQ